MAEAKLRRYRVIIKNKNTQLEMVETVEAVNGAELDRIIQIFLTQQSLDPNDWFIREVIVK